jgi:hypothetical protein
MNLRARVLAATIVVLVGLAPSHVHAAGDDLNGIPGVLLVGSSATGAVGGPIYDQVWRLELSDPRVLNLRLDPLEADAQLGLYLLADGLTSLQDEYFDLYTLKSSSLPGGVQRITTAVRPGTYYINVNGRNVDRAYRFSLTLSLVPDPTPPIATLALAGGKSLIDSALTTASITARDALSGVDSYRIRVAGEAWGDWATVQTISTLSITVPLQLRAASGLQRVDLETRNPLGLVSELASDSVTLDLSIPRATRLSPSGTDGITTVAKPVVTYQFSEPMIAATWLAGGLSVTFADGQPVVGKFTYDTKLRRGSWVPTTNLPLGSTIVVSGGSPTDLAGNRAVIEPLSLTYLAPTKLVAAAASGKPFIDAPLNLRVTSTGIQAGATVWLEHYVGTEWVGYRSTTLTATGGRVNMPVPESGRYRWRYQSDGLRKEAISSEFTIAVRPRVVLTGQSTSSTRSVVRGRAVTIAGVANPVSTSVKLTLYSCNSSFSSCTPRETTPLVPGADGNFSLTWSPAKGYWAWGVKSTATAEFSAGASPLYRFRAP